MTHHLHPRNRQQNVHALALIAVLFLGIGRFSTASTMVAAQATPIDDQGSGDLTINLALCPDGSDLADASFNPVQDCTTPLNGATFVITGQNTGYVSQENTGDSSNGAVLFGEVPADIYTITETPTIPNAQVISLGCDTSGSPITGNTLTITIGGGDTIACTFFNAPPLDDTEMTPTAPPGVPATPVTIALAPTVSPGTTGSIVVFTFRCPYGYDPGAAQSIPGIDCTPFATVTSFTLQQQGSSNPYSTIRNTAGSVVEFDLVPAGTYAVSEIPPIDNASMFVGGCSDQSSATYQLLSPELHGTQITLPLTARHQIACYWYNVPMAGSGSIDLNKQDCTSPTYANYLHCAPSTRNAYFEVYRSSGGVWTYVNTVYTDTIGHVLLSGYTPGTYKIVEIGRTPCHIDIPHDPDGPINNDPNSFLVVDNQLIRITIYDCATSSGRSSGEELATTSDPEGTADGNAASARANPPAHENRGSLSDDRAWLSKPSRPSA
ncbi:MAG: hypothetical protein QM589_09550 [Thermomicrobiales bacterium]